MQTAAEFMKSHPILIVFISFVIGFVGLYLLPSGHTFWGMVPSRIVLAVIMLAIMTAVGGWTVARPSPKGLTYALRKSAYPLSLALIVGLLAIMPLFSGQEALNSDWLMLSIGAIALCLFVGLFEESLFRGIILNGMLAKTQGTRSGIVVASILSSLLFGFMHVAPNLIVGGIADSSTLLQAILKTIQTGVLGFFLCGVYLKTHNIWTVSIVHALNDLFPLVANAIVSDGSLSSYVYSDPTMGSLMISAYAMWLVLYIPIIILAVRIFLRLDVPDRGFFTDSRSKPST